MTDELRKYIEELVKGIPIIVYVGLLSIFIVGVVLLLIMKEKKFGRYFAILLLIEYIILIYSSTVLFRIPNGMETILISPLWSYNKPNLLVQNIMNVIVFLPLGLLLGCAVTENKWWKVMTSVFFISLSIEVLQFVFKRGYTELDDLIHNTLGCMIGFGLFSIFKIGYDKNLKGKW